MIDPATAAAEQFDRIMRSTRVDYGASVADHLTDPEPLAARIRHFGAEKGSRLRFG